MRWLSYLGTMAAELTSGRMVTGNETGSTIVLRGSDMPTQFPIDRYLNIRAANGPSFSPDGRFVSFLTHITGVSQVWQIPVEGGWPVQLTLTSESVRSRHYNQRRHELIYSREVGAHEHTELFRSPGVG